MEGDISMLSSLNEKQILPAVENKNNYDIDKNAFKPDCLPYLISKSNAKSRKGCDKIKILKDCR